MADAQPTKNLPDAVSQRLAVEWEATVSAAVDQPRQQGADVPAEITESIRACVNSKTKTYRYVLPTQLLAKLVAPQLDCRAVQAGSALPNSFDARSVCHGPIVAFDRANNNVLGGSAEPYLNNPLRIPDIMPARRTAQKNKADFDRLVGVLGFAEAHPEAVGDLVRVLLQAVASRLNDVRVVYPVPNRASLRHVLGIFDGFLADSSGGLRLQAVAVALFRAIGSTFGLFAEVRAAAVNAADTSTGFAADLECVGEDGRTVLAVEIKDRELTLHQMQDKLPAVRERGIRELLFVASGGIADADADEVNAAVDREFVTGQNVYVIEFRPFLETTLTLLGEKGRRTFLEQVGVELDRVKADVQHRRRWAKLLAAA